MLINGSSTVEGACACCTVPPHVHCIESFASSCLLLLSVPPTGKYVYFSTFVYFIFPKAYVAIIVSSLE